MTERREPEYSDTMSTPKTLTGKEASDFVDDVIRKSTEQRASMLAHAKQAAIDKEPFDLAKLEEMCDTSSEGRMDPVEERQEKFERMYYVSHPELKTIAELARLVDELNKW